MKKAVAEKLLKEFNEYYENMQEDDKIHYNRIMAADRATGLLCIYKDYITPDELKDVKNKANTINNIGIGHCTVSFGYTESGLHITALRDMQDNSSMKYEKLCNFLRQNNQEVAMFTDLYFNHECFLSDVYIENLKNQRETFNVKLDSILIDGPEFKMAKEVKNLDDKTKEALKKYNRTIEPKDGIYRNRTWRLIATEKISDFLRIYVDNEKIDLVSEASDKQNYQQ